MELLIREARLEDVDEIKELWKEFVDFHKVHDPFFVRTSDGHEHFGQFVQDNISRDDWLVLVAVDKGKIIGYCMATIKEYPPVYINTRYGYIQDIAVTQGHRCKGIGTQLLKRMIPWFKGEGVSRIELDVVAANEVSQSFWHKMGFRNFMIKLAKDLQEL